MTSIGTHVLDTETGMPAQGVRVTVHRQVEGEWVAVGGGTTDPNGRIVPLAVGLVSGIYRVVFDTAGYGNPFYPEVSIVVDLDETEDHYHLPLLLSPYGYTTYRGS